MTLPGQGCMAEVAWPIDLINMATHTQLSALKHPCGRRTIVLGPPLVRMNWTEELMDRELGYTPLRPPPVAASPPLLEPTFQSQELYWGLYLALYRKGKSSPLKCYSQLIRGNCIKYKRQKSFCWLNGWMDGRLSHDAVAMCNGLNWRQSLRI